MLKWLPVAVLSNLDLRTTIEANLVAIVPAVDVFNNAGWGLVHLEMEESGLPVFTEGATFKNPDFAMFAQSCGGTGFRVTRPDALRDTVARALATPGPVVVDVAVDPNELPAMPHNAIEQVWKLGIGKIRELISG